MLKYCKSKPMKRRHPNHFILNPKDSSLLWVSSESSHRQMDWMVPSVPSACGGWLVGSTVRPAAPATAGGHPPGRYSGICLLHQTRGHSREKAAYKLQQGLLDNMFFSYFGLFIERFALKTDDQINVLNRDAKYRPYDTPKSIT